MNHLLEADSIVFQCGFHRILNGAFIKCETGKVTGLLGRNGAGKSCLMQVVFGGLRAQEASVKLDGRFKSRACNHLDIRYLPQSTFVPSHFKLRQVFRDYGTDFDKFLEIFPEFRKVSASRMGKLSGGERRLIEVYNILVCETKFSFLDEPFAQLMPLHIELLKELIRKESERKGILVSDHLYQDVMDISDELYVLRGGKSLKIKEPEDLKRLGYLHTASY